MESEGSDLVVEFKFCPVCGGRLEKRRMEDKERLVCVECGYVFYQNPKPCVGGLVEKDGKLMLTKRGIEPFFGWWDLPGGFLEVGEHPEEGIKREIMEETGLEVKVKDLIGIYMDTYGKDGVSTLNIHYLVEPVRGVENPQSDITEIKWFSPSEIPSNIAFENCKKAIHKWQKLRRQ